MAFLRDLKIALRSLSRTPALWITVALTLALGIGANAAIFSVVRTVLLKPLANRDENRLLYVRQSAPGLQLENATFSVPEISDLNGSPNFGDLRSTTLKTIQSLGTFSEVDFSMVGLGTPRSIHAGVVDGNYFNVIGLQPVLGRLIGPSDDKQDAPGVAVLTYKFWTASLHSDPNILGKAVRFESFGGARSATIIGVLEPSAPYPAETEVIANIVTSPHHLSATMVTGREHRMTELFARLNPNATLEQARAELQTRYNSILAGHPEVYKAADHYQITVTPIHQQINARANTVLWVLFAASGLLFIIACSNTANLVLARTVRRESELAIRAALGATTRSLRRSLLAESLVLCGSGAIAALLLAWPMVAILGKYAARFSVRADGLSLDFTLVWFGIGLCLLAAIFLAYVPRLPNTNVAQSFTAAQTGGRVVGGSHRRLRIFAITQITASFLLLAGAAALLRTLITLTSTPAPFDTAHVLAVNLPVISYGRTPQQIQTFYRDVQNRVATLPGVDHVASGFGVPWRDAQELNISFAFAITGARRQDAREDLRAKFRSISPNYFATLGIPLLDGRDFRDSDREGSEPVVIISQSVANTLFPGQSALNRKLEWTDNVLKFVGIGYQPRRIVGVVPDVDDQHIIPSPTMTVYQPADQEGWTGRLFVHTSGDPYALVTPITRTIQSMAADQPVERASSLADIRAEVLTPDRLNAIVFGGFAAVALAISVVGVAGVLAFSVSGRIREFGIRMAMGAQPSSILRGVLRDGLIIASIGVAGGILAGFALLRIAIRYITAIQQPGAISFIASAAVILLAALIAAAIPAARAARVNPMEALRNE
jgi:predicted permease